MYLGEKALIQAGATMIEDVGEAVAQSDGLVHLRADPAQGLQNDRVVVAQIGAISDWLAMHDAVAKQPDMVDAVPYGLPVPMGARNRGKDLTDHGAVVRSPQRLFEGAVEQSGPEAEIQFGYDPVGIGGLVRFGESLASLPDSLRLPGSRGRRIRPRKELRRIKPEGRAEKVREGVMQTISERDFEGLE